MEDNYSKTPQLGGALFTRTGYATLRTRARTGLFVEVGNLRRAGSVIHIRNSLSGRATKAIGVAAGRAG